MKTKKERHGFIMAGALLVILVILIAIPSFIFLTKSESDKTQKNWNDTKAFHLAEAGQDRGIWKLRESDAIWDQLITSGTAITGYDSDVVYTDIDGGSYKIAITSGPGANEATIISKGRSSLSNDVRAIKAIYSPEGTADIPAISVEGAVQWRPNLEVHWGPVISYTSIDQAPSDLFPRKYSAGQIVGRDTTNDSNNGALPSENWATYDYAAFQDLGTPPTIDLDYYRTKATNSCIGDTLKRTSGNAAASRDTSVCNDSGYYLESIWIKESGGGGSDFVFSCSTCVIFVEGDVAKFPNGAWLDIEALVVTGDCDFNGRSTSYDALIPKGAEDEYQADTSEWTGNSWVEQSTETITNAGMHGFYYCGGDLSNAGGGAILIGAVYVGGQLTTNTMTVYYDERVVTSIPVSAEGTIYRQSWDEINIEW